MLLAVLGTVFSCQRVELPEEDIPSSPEAGVFGKATISFSAMLPSTPETKVMGDEPLGSENNDIESMYLVIFDENGMLVETCEAKLAGVSGTHDTEISTGKQDENGDDITYQHLYETEFTVTVTMTDQPRIIHFIANCPVDQVLYGHETSVIGNMYVEKDKDAGTPETAYWARIEVSDLIIEDAEENPHFKNEDVANAFKCVPMLRNFAQITVVDTESEKITVPDGHTFEYLGFTLYNTVDIGTVAPYNSKSGEFQSFINPTTGLKYKYPALMELTDADGKSIAYEGHALAAAKLNQSLEMDSSSDDGYKWYPSGSSFYMYERKISVKTDEEEMWNESPPHLIIKGLYDGERCYYKADLVYKIIENGKDEAREIKYYNILRNFKYQFTITKVDSKGYESVEAAIRGATSNNLAGSSTTSKFTNISDNVGRLWVSYTSKTLVTGDDITLYYRYEPVLGSGNFNNNTVEQGGVVFFEDLAGNPIEGSNVIKEFKVAATDEKDGEWEGYRRVDIKVNAPQAMAKEQTVVLRTDKATLSRQIHYTLRNKYTMEVDCTRAVLAKIGEEVQMDIKLPGGLTANMFPLALRIEVADMTLSPNADKNTIPVEVGTSSVPGKEGEPAFFYVWTIETKEDYDKLPSEGTNKVIETYWYTNIAKSASTIYVTNSYFNPADDSFLNGVIFTKVSVTANNANTNTELESLFYGEKEKVGITFTMSTDDANYQNKQVTVKLNGLTDAAGNTEFTHTVGNNRTVTINNLVTTSLDGNVSFTVSHQEYISVTSDEVTRYPGTFSDLKVGSAAEGEDIPKGADYKTSVSFKLDDADSNPTGRTILVEFDGLIDGNGQTSQTITPTGREVVIENLYTLTNAGNVSFTVKEVNGVYTSAKAVFGRSDLKFTNLSLPQNIRQGENRKVTISFQMSESDPEFASREVTVKLYGLKDQNGNDEIKEYPKAGDKTVTIKDLLTSSVNDGIYFTVEADGYEKNQSNTANRTRGTFSNLTFSQNGTTVTSLPAATSQYVDFSFEMSDYEDGMPITVELEGLQPADNALTRSTTYTYTVKGTGKQTIKLKTIAGSSECWVKLSAEEYGFDATKKEDATLTLSNKITIEKGKLIATITGTTFDNGGTIYIYTTSNCSGTALTNYKYTRGKNGNTNNAKATNSSAITLEGVSSDTTLYICYTKNNTKYTGSFKVSDATDSDGVTVAIKK